MKFLMIAQAPSDNTKALAEVALASLRAHSEPVSEVIFKAPLAVRADDLAGCDGLLLGTMENIGALSGLTKDMFDRCYNDWLGRHEGLPVAIYIRAGLDGTATRRTLLGYANALSWRLIQEPLVLHGSYQDDFTEQVAALAGQLSAGVEAGIY